MFAAAGRGERMAAPMAGCCMGTLWAGGSFNRDLNFSLLNTGNAHTVARRDSERDRRRAGPGREIPDGNRGWA